MIDRMDREIAGVLRQPIPREVFSHSLSVALSRPHLVHHQDAPTTTAPRVLWVVAGTVAGAVGASATIFGIRRLHRRSVA